MYVLAVNAGSATLKVALYQSDEVVLQRFHVHFSEDVITVKVAGEVVTMPVPEDRDGRYRVALQYLLAQLGCQPEVVVHRVVHGGPDFTDHQLIDAEVLENLKELIPFAPLHQPYNIRLIEACAELLPDVSQVACFDTVFHSTLPDVAKRYALPYSCYEKGERVYGYHGLSYEYICHAFAEMHPQYAGDRVVIAHLGSGASMCGVKAGRSRATTMGFSTFEGLPMSTRPGHFDPGLIFYWLDQGMDIKAIEKMLYKESGLLGLSGLSSDYRILEEADSVEAGRAIESLVFSINKSLGALVAQLGGVDHLIFTAGVGENSSMLRSKVVELASQWLPLSMDEAANTEGELSISASDSTVGLWVVPTDEEQMMVKHAKRLVN